MKTFYKIILTIYSLTLCYVLFFQFQLNTLVSIILLIPTFFIKYNLYKIEYLIYIYFTQLLGSSCGLYSLPYYDKLMHFMSGFIFVMIGYILLKPYIQTKKTLYIMINCVEMSVGFLWEVFEYMGLILFQYDASRHFSTGVHDTMQDMIFSLLAGLIMTYIIYKYPSYIDNLYKQPQDTPVEVSL